MNKLAIFVEGQTEQLFIENLIIKIFGTNQIMITKNERRGKKDKRNVLQLEAESKSNDVQYFILIVDCGGDGQVKSDICEQYTGLSSAGYQKIVGVRDAYPTVAYKEIPRLREGLAACLPVGPVPVIFILGVMEIEAWILAEYMHFPKIHPKITVDRIKQELKIDTINDDLSKREAPARDLSDIYMLELIDYDKSHKIVSSILSALDYSHLRNSVSLKFSDLNVLCCEFELFFSKTS